MHLRDFLEQHGSQLASTIEKNLTPIYNPLNPEGIDEFEEKIPLLLRRPFPVQSELIKGIAKALYRAGRHHLFVTGDGMRQDDDRPLYCCDGCFSSTGARRLPHAPCRKVDKGDEVDNAGSPRGGHERKK